MVGNFTVTRLYCLILKAMIIISKTVTLQPILVYRMLSMHDV